MKTFGRSGMHLYPPWLQEHPMQSTHGIDRGGKHPSEDKITTKTLDAKNQIQSTNST
jgi:hypothetical protein